MADWFDTNWLNRVKVTIDNTKVSGSGSHADFPVLITEANMPASFFDKVKSDGTDIVVTETDGTTKQKREVVSIDTVGDKLELWTKSSSLSTSADTDIYIYYNNSAASETNDTDTWNSDFVGVYHMDDDPDTSTIQDSTAANADGTKGAAGEPAEVNGSLGKAQSFDGVDDKIDVTGITKNMNLITISTSINPTNLGEGNGGRILKMAGGAQSEWDLRMRSTTKLRFAQDRWSTTTGQWNSPDNSYAFGSWTYVSVTYDAGSTTNDPEFRKNGDVIATTEIQTPAGTLDTGDSDVIIGNNVDQSRTFDGDIEEIKISKVIRSGDWIKTEANNFNSASTFYSVAAEEDAPPGQPYSKRVSYIPGMRTYQPKHGLFLRPLLARI